MRLVAALLFVALTGTASLADEAKPADPKPEVTRGKVPLRVVRMLPETRQVLLHDKNRGTHVVAEVGQEVDGYIVDEIEGDEVTLVAPSGAEVILTAPEISWRRRAAERKAAARTGNPAEPTPAATGAAATLTGALAPTATPAGASPSAAATGPAPIDPYADAPPSATSAAGASAPSPAAPIVAGEGGVRVASASEPGPTAAPIVDGGAPTVADPYAELDPGIAAFVDAVGATPAPSAPAAATAAPTAPSRTPAPSASPADATTTAAGTLAAAATGSPAPAAASAGMAVTVSRRDIDAALADFGATAVTFDAAFVADGLRFDHIASGTILARLGLQNGDVLTAVDQQRLRSLDDAASLYARAGSTKAATLHVLRGGKPMTLRVTIR